MSSAPSPPLDVAALLAAEIPKIKLSTTSSTYHPGTFKSHSMIFAASSQTVGLRLMYEIVRVDPGGPDEEVESAEEIFWIVKSDGTPGGSFCFELLKRRLLSLGASSAELDGGAFTFPSRATPYSTDIASLQGAVPLLVEVKAPTGTFKSKSKWVANRVLAWTDIGTIMDGRRRIVDGASGQEAKRPKRKEAEIEQIAPSATTADEEALAAAELE